MATSSDGLSPAQALGKLRWKGTTKAARKTAMKDLAAKRHESLSPERRLEIAQKASAAAKVKRDAEKKKANKSSRRKSIGSKKKATANGAVDKKS